MRVLVIVGVGAAVAFGLSLVLPVWLWFGALFAAEVVGGIAGDRLPRRPVEPVVRRRALGWWFVHDPIGRSRLAVSAGGGALALSALLFEGVAWYFALGLWVLVASVVAVEYSWFRRDARAEGL
ncbi:hypothetical protein ACFYOT_11920 [Saccharothrix saharensis]|uniref:hypothetical protein n=1 Tax=Saccharothrix saharensis TaxID=571190 RepID=UPI0036A32251